MKLTKQQVLDLVKVLSHYETFDQVYSVNVPYGDLLARFEEYLVGDDDESRDNSEKTDKNKKARKVSSKQANKAKLLEQEDEESDEADDEGEELDGQSDREDEEGDASECDGHIAASEFKCLTKADKFRCETVASSEVATYSKFDLYFDYDHEFDRVDVIDSDDNYFLNARYIQRNAKEFYVSEDNADWHCFKVNKFPKSLTKLLPCGKTLKIVQG